MRTAMGERSSALTTHIEGIGKVSITSFRLVWLPSRFLDRETRVRVQMSLRSKYLGILSGMVPAGAVGVLLLLGSVAPCDASDQPTNPLPSATEGIAVERVRGVGQPNLDEKQIADALREYGVSLIAFQPEFWTDLREMAPFRGAAHPRLRTDRDETGLSSGPWSKLEGSSKSRPDSTHPWMTNGAQVTSSAPGTSSWLIPTLSQEKGQSRIARNGAPPYPVCPERATIISIAL
jgi:hypothetical protein